MQLNAKRLDIIGSLARVTNEQALDKIASIIDSLPGDDFERIPGLAYTLEERVTSVLEAEEDIRAGRFISQEDMGKWINGLA